MVIEPDLIRAMIVELNNFQRWGAPTPSYVELEDRQVPFVPTRLPPNEPLESALEQVNTASFSCMTFPLPRPLQVSFTSKIIFYQFYELVHSSYAGFLDGRG